MYKYRAINYPVQKRRSNSFTAILEDFHNKIKTALNLSIG